MRRHLDRFLCGTLILGGLLGLVGGMVTLVHLFGPIGAFPLAPLAAYAVGAWWMSRPEDLWP